MGTDGFDDRGNTENDCHYADRSTDEGEPGTFKDRMIMLRAPHQLIEGMIIAGFAVNSNKGYIYVRGEYTEPIAALEKALKEAQLKDAKTEVEKTRIQIDIDRLTRQIASAEKVQENV